MRAQLSHYETFYWVARLGSFHAAARQLQRTQPTISARIQDLEQALGKRLFDRARQRPRLTADGRELLAAAERLLHMAEEIEDAAQRTQPLRGLLRLGAVESVALTALPKLSTFLSERHPHLKIELTLDVGNALGRKLLAGELDLAFLTDPVSDGNVSNESMGRIDMRWIAGPRMPLPNRPLGPADLAPLPIITNPRPSSLDSVITAWFAGSGLQPQHINRCNSLMLMARLVAAGYGLTVLPPAILRSEIQQGKLRVLRTERPVQGRVLYASYPVQTSQAIVSDIIAATRSTLLRSRLLARVPQV